MEGATTVNTTIKNLSFFLEKKAQQKNPVHLTFYSFFFPPRLLPWAEGKDDGKKKKKLQILGILGILYMHDIYVTTPLWLVKDIRRPARLLCARRRSISAHPAGAREPKKSLVYGLSTFGVGLLAAGGCDEDHVLFLGGACRVAV
jgi:hypothetical protein